MKKDMWKRFNLLRDSTDSQYDFENDTVDDEYCEKLLSKPSSKTYAALNKWLENCPKEWIENFLDAGALHFMFSTLNFMGLKKAKFSDAVIELEIIRSIKLILNSLVGIEYLINFNEEHALMGSLVLGEFIS